MSEKVIYSTVATFEEDVINSELPVLVDFWAEWCGPCKMIAPVIDAIAEEYDGRLRVVKLDVDANNETPPKFNVRGIPTLIIFKNGQAVGDKVGALSRGQLIQFVEENL